jgi:ribosome-binding protein aMBF1 (putative translation factor)
MSERMKKALTKKNVNLVIFSPDANAFHVPKNKISGLLILLDEYRSKSSFKAEDVFAEAFEKYSKVGAVLQGARLKEEMSQVELAKKLKINQSDLSKMEHGKRPIGKKMAKKLSAILNIDYRVFL